jgi:hypothetical protein
MSPLQHTQQLDEAALRTRERAENAIVALMLDAGLRAREPVDKYVTWSLVAAGALASGLVAHGERMIELLSPAGFVTCGLLLVASALFGFLAKAFNVQCSVAVDTGIAVETGLLQHLEVHEQHEERLAELASQVGHTVDASIRMERVEQQFLSVMPWWVRLRVRRVLRKNRGHPQLAYLARISTLNAQVQSAFIQALGLVGSLGAAVIFAAATAI